MSDIKVGDLVMVVKLKPCGCGTLGFTFRVVAFTTDHRPTRCTTCQTVVHPAYEPTVTYSTANEANTAIYRLKRIPPPEELGIVDEKHDLPATV